MSKDVSTENCWGRLEARRTAMDKEKLTRSEEEAARDANLASREKALSDELEMLESQVKPKKPNPAPIGSMF